ncbi:10709_t:CDS:10, partial [Entrophospora sp. SA101]
RREVSGNDLFRNLLIVKPAVKKASSAGTLVKFYFWLLIVTGVFAFINGFGIGANDLANSFSAAVASKALTLKQACLIAVVTEFSGAFFLGVNTAETLRNNVINIDHFKERPDLLMQRITCVYNTFNKLTIIFYLGAILGVGIAAYGPGIVTWSYNGGVLKIITSWIISPFIAGAAGALIFFITQYFILEADENSFERGLVAVPVYFAITMGINILFLVYKEEMAPVVIGVSLILAAFSYFFFAQWIRRKVIDGEDLKIRHIFIVPFMNPRFNSNNALSGVFDTCNSNDSSSKNSVRIHGQDFEITTTQQGIILEIQGNKSMIRIFFDKIIKILTYSLNKDVATYRKEARQDLYDVARKYDKSTESLYTFLQVLTSALASFVHGSNDVVNAVGPLATVLEIYQQGSLGSYGQIPVWVLALGGAAIDMGLVFYGYNVMRSLGNQITYHSPSRGFSMELGTSLTVLMASRLGLPISTTQCITGATIGVGLLNHLRKVKIIKVRKNTKETEKINGDGGKGENLDIVVINGDENPITSQQNNDTLMTLENQDQELNIINVNNKKYAIYNDEQDNLFIEDENGDSISSSISLLQGRSDNTKSGSNTNFKKCDDK